eukprot:2391341-Rhodomonas_salina.2
MRRGGKIKCCGERWRPVESAAYLWGFCRVSVGSRSGGGLLQKMNRDTMSFACKVHPTRAQYRACRYFKVHREVRFRGDWLGVQRTLAFG